jgi:hypothetical protein
LIQRKQENRLGYNGISELKNHPWFKKTDWEKIENRKIIPSFLPPVTFVIYQRQFKKITKTTNNVFLKILKLKIWLNIR